MTPQELLNEVYAIEAEMVGLAVSLTTTPSLRYRQDSLARVTVAAEGIEHMVGELIAVEGRSPGSVPFVGHLEDVARASKTRTRALQEIIQRGDFSTGAMANVPGVVETTESLLMSYANRLQTLSASGVLAAFLREFGGER